jgi:hypothetical protein
MIALSAAMRNVTIAFLLLFSVAVRAQDSFSDHYEKAQSLLQNAQYQAAVDELDAAYQLRQLPQLLYELGRAHQMLGHTAEASGFLKRYLAAEMNPPADLRADAERRLQQLRALAAADAPPPPVAVDPRLHFGAQQLAVRYELRSDRPLIAGGAALFASSYLAATIAGSLFVGSSGGNNCSDSPLANNSGCFNTQAAGGVLFIPLLGPFISAGGAANPSWSVPWAMVDGMAQAAGLAMIIAGIRHKTKVPVYGDRINVAPVASASSAGVSFSGRF